MESIQHTLFFRISSSHPTRDDFLGSVIDCLDSCEFFWALPHPNRKNFENDYLWFSLSLFISLIAAVKSMQQVQEYSFWLAASSIALILFAIPFYT
jgi:hypothetical protein